MHIKKNIMYGSTAVIMIALALAFTACPNVLTKQRLAGEMRLSNYSPKVGESITAFYDRGNGTGAQKWQWFRVDTEAKTETVILSADTDTYIATTEDLGKKIKVYLSFTGWIGSLHVITDDAVAPATRNADDIITYTVTETGGADKTNDSNGTDSTGIVFTFSAPVDSLNLTADDIAVGERAAKDPSAALTGSEKIWTLSPIIVTHAGLATVQITKNGIDAETHHVDVYKAGELLPTLTGITAAYNGTAIYPTTPLDSLKDHLIVKAQFSDTNEEELFAHEYSLSVSGGGTLTVGTPAITVTYTHDGVTKTYEFTVTVTPAPVAHITYNVVQTGGEDNITDSTGIIFTFSASVDSLNLTATDITVGERAAKDANATLTGTGITRTLSPIIVTHAGLATVQITKNGIDAETHHVDVYKAGELLPTLTGITAAYNGTAIYPTTPLDSLKDHLIVKAQFSDTNEEELFAHEYSLSVSGGGTLTVGENTITVTYTHDGGTETDEFTVNVIVKTDPEVTWPTAATIMYGVALSTSTLTGGAGDGSFEWTDGAVIPTVTNSGYEVTFTPTDTATFNTLTQNVEITVLLGVDMVRVNNGTFTMGSSESSDYSGPVHQVTLTEDFYLGKYEITQRQWYEVMGSLPSSLFQNYYGRGDNYPVYYISWYNAIFFCNKLSLLEGLTPAYRIDGKTNPDEWGAVPTASNATWNAIEIVAGSNGYRLPTEAQWEYAARGGTSASSPYKTYAGSDNIDDVAWHSGNSGGIAHEVGKKQPNELGIYDMSGNAAEWCWDWNAAYTSEAAIDPTGPSSANFRASRDGTWYHTANYSNPARRASAYPQGVDGNHRYRGFRLARPANSDLGGSITKTDPAVTWPADLRAIPGQTLSKILLASYTNGGTPGTFSWTTPSHTVGALGIQSHNMTFTPNNTTNFNTVTGNVNVNVAERLLEMVRVEHGTFTMGSPTTETGRGTNETQWEVTLTNDFYLGKYEVTQKQFETVMEMTVQAFQKALQPNSDTDYGRGDNLPIYPFRWVDALVFCNKLSMMEGLTPAYSLGGSTDPSAWGEPTNSSSSPWFNPVIVEGSNGYRLPTEAQWEYAARGGHLAGEYKLYSGSDNVDDVAWYNGNNGSAGTPTSGLKQVGTKAPNELGIYDMSGNAAEWCWDRYQIYPTEPETDPMGGPSTQSSRVYRGGSYSGTAQYVRSAWRSYMSPIQSGAAGFRILCPAE